jgi:hypothetical protein
LLRNGDAVTLGVMAETPHSSATPELREVTDPVLLDRIRAAAGTMLGELPAERAAVSRRLSALSEADPWSLVVANQARQQEAVFAATCAYWARKPAWTLSEAASLCVGIDPRWSPAGPDYAALFGPTPRQQMSELADDLQRLCGLGVIREVDEPRAFLKSMAGRIDVPAALLLAVMGDGTTAETAAPASDPPAPDAAAPATPDPAVESASDQSTRKGGGGRPAEWPWDMVREHVLVQQAFHGGLSADDPEWRKPADVVRSVTDFIRKNKLGEEPSPSTLKAKVRLWLAEWDAGARPKTESQGQ